MQALEDLLCAVSGLADLFYKIGELCKAESYEMKFIVHLINSNVTQTQRHSAFATLKTDELGKLFDANTPSAGASAVPDIVRALRCGVLSADLARTGRW